MTSTGVRSSRTSTKPPVPGIPGHCVRDELPYGLHLPRMEPRRSLAAYAKRWRTIGLVALAVLGLGSLAVAFLGRPADADAPLPESAPTGPPADDVPDAAAPPGEVRPGTVGGAPVGQGRARLVPDQLLVKFEAGTQPGVVSAVLARAGATTESRIPHTGTLVVELPPAERSAALALLDASGAVEYVEPDVVMSVLETAPNDAFWPNQWGLQNVAAPRAWDVARGSPSVVVAVLDTGVNFAHVDLQGRSVPGYDAVNNDADPADDHGHGTAVAGVLAARTNNGEGVAGLCWTCSLMAVKVLDATGSGSTSTIARGIVWAVDHGARVINLSLGAPGSTQALADAVAYAAAKGVVLVAAAGNSGVSAWTYPAAYPGVISVGGTDPAGARYPWSNFGGWVQVAAPGCNVAPLARGGYGEFCGTSSAAPVVAGIAALALSAKPAAARAELEQAIRSAVASTVPGIQYGRVDASRTLSALGVSFPPPPAPPAPPPPPAASPSPPAAPLTSATAQGRISQRHPTWAVRRTVAPGRVAAVVTFRGTSRLTLSIVSPSGATVRRVTAGTPLRTALTARAGSYRFVVSGRNVRAASFTLRLSYPAP